MKGKQQQKAAKQSKNDKAVTTKATAVVATKAAKAMKTVKPVAEPKRTIKQLIIETITKNSAVTNGEIIAAVKAEFPESGFKDTHASWYRSQARKGLLTGTPIVIPAMSRKQSPTVN